MLNKLFGAAAARVVGPLAAAAARAGVTPNMVTVAGFVITGAAAVVIALGGLRAGGLILVGGALLDMLDGAVARASGKGSKAGAFLDSTLDRLSDAGIFAGIVWYYATGGLPARAVTESALLQAPEVGAGRAGVMLALAALILSLMVSYVRARAEGLGFDCRVGIAERPERVAVLAVGLVFDLLLPALAVLSLLSAVTVFQRFVHVWRQARAA